MVWLVYNKYNFLGGIMKKMLAVAASAVFSCILAGCASSSTSTVQKKSIVDTYKSGDAIGALDIAKRRAFFTGDDELVWRLECGSLNFEVGNFADAMLDFKQSEKLIEANHEKAFNVISKSGGDIITSSSNPNNLPYRGWNRDRTYISVLEAFCCLGMGDEDAFYEKVAGFKADYDKIMADFNRLTDVENKQLERFKAEHKDVAAKASQMDFSKDGRNGAYQMALKKMGIYIQRGYGDFINPMMPMLVGICAMRSGNDAAACQPFEALFNVMPKSNLAKKYYATALAKAGKQPVSGLQEVKPFDFSLANNCVYVFFAHDIMASLKQYDVYFPTKIAWQACDFNDAKIGKMTVRAGAASYEGETIADMDGITAREFVKRVMPTCTRVLFSVLVKEAEWNNKVDKIRAEGEDAKEVVVAGKKWTDYRDKLNVADTRSWMMLPKEIQMTQLPMPAGRSINISASGIDPLKVSIPDDCGSAIVFVSALTKDTVKAHVFPLK